MVTSQAAAADKFPQTLQSFGFKHSAPAAPPVVVQHEDAIALVIDCLTNKN